MRSAKQKEWYQEVTKNKIDKRKLKKKGLLNGGFNYEPHQDISKYVVVIIGSMSIICTHCSAKKFKKETLKGSDHLAHSWGGLGRFLGSQ